MDVNVGDAMVVVKCSGGTLTFDIDITFETVVAGSTATGILSQVHNRQLRILYSRPFAGTLFCMYATACTLPKTKLNHISVAASILNNVHASISVTLLGQ